MAAPTTADSCRKSGDSPLLPGPEELADFPQRKTHSIAWVPLCLMVVSVFTTASTGALLMRNFRLNQPPLANEGDLFPLHWICRGMRSVFLPNDFATVEAGGAWQHGTTALVLGGWCILGFVLCARTFRWSRR